MATLFNITLESNQLTGSADSFDGTVNAGDLAVTSPGLASTAYKLTTTIDDTANRYGVKNQTAPASNKIGLRAYIDPNSLTMSDGDSFYALKWSCTGTPSVLLIIRLQRNDPNYELNVQLYRDNSTHSDHVETITDVPHYVEVQIVRASANDANDGSGKLLIDGVLKHTYSGIDNYDTFPNIDAVYVGPSGSLDAGTSGTLLFDEIKANDDGSEIGPVVAGVPTQMNYYRRRRIS